MGQLKFVCQFLPHILECWKELTLIVEAFLKELLNTVNISVKIPVKNTELYKCKIKVLTTTVMTNFYPTFLIFYWSYLKTIAISEPKTKG